MPRFYFDIDHGRGVLVDEDGSSHPDANGAREEAMTVAAQLSKDHLLEHKDREMVVTVRDETREPIFKATVMLKGEWLAGNRPV